LVEAVADAVCQRLLKEFDIQKVIIRVRKPHAPINADFKNVEVELLRFK
jgi:dihydroneopterin aldolase